MKAFTATAALCSALLLGGCAYHAGSADYRAHDMGGEQVVLFGVVEIVRDVRIQAPITGVGSASGAFAGSVAGSYVGGGSGQFWGSLAGMILGGMMGHAIETEASSLLGVEVTVLLDSGKYIAVVQGASEPFRAGDRVRVLSGRTSTRVTH